MTLSLAICGCGVMGRRHVLGLKALKSVGRLRFDLVAAVDPFAASGESLADQAEDLLGRRPRVFPDWLTLRHALAPDAVAVTTSPDLHAAIATEALAAGAHVLVEKPIALTVRQGRTMVAAAVAAGKRLAVAENYRRDPINRLAKSVVESGAIGRPILILQSSAGWGERVIITPWRHQKAKGGIAVDMGVHYADLFEYVLGPIASVVGFNAIVDTERKDAGGAMHPVDAEDLTVGAVRFAGGALGNLLLHLAGRGESHFQRVIHGTAGSLGIPVDRSGHALTPTLRRGDGRDEAIPEDAQLRLVPDFALDPTTAALFGGDRLTSYALDWAAIDANLLAIEYDDFAGAIVDDRPPEVAGEDGLRSLAIAYGFLEADRLGRVVSLDELLRGEASAYQDELEGAATTL